MLRIIAGQLKGRRIQAPPNPRITRPTLDRVRETIFNILHHHPDCPSFEDACILDLFSGSGSLGYEALSRGATRATFVDRDRLALECCRRNAETLNVANHCLFVCDDTRSVLFPQAPFDIILIDPPYYKGMSEPTLENILRQNALTDGGMIALEMAADEHLQKPDGLVCVKEVTCGPGRLYFLIKE